MTTLFQSTILRFAGELFDSYDSYKLCEITSNRFTQAEMLLWMHPLNGQNAFEKSFLGTSAEGREIALYTIGEGSTKVMLWSQMHGDEPTATMALLDIFSFFAKNPEHIVANTIREKLTLLAIPMLNPDGAEGCTRRTSQMIDINRDASALVTPEAKILKSTRDTYQPEFGFNLHDQDPRYTVGTTQNITAIALLAPASDELRRDNPVRLRAKRVASTIAHVLNLYIPENLAKWDDTFTPTAFGDMIQKWGTSTVLIESGGWRGDPSKFFLRKLNCVGLLTTLYAIAIGESDRADIAVYEKIPFNTNRGCDYIIRNAELKAHGQAAPLRVDVGINFDRHINSATIIEIGDLNAWTALEKEVNANGAEIDADLVKFEHSFALEKVESLVKPMRTI